MSPSAHILSALLIVSGFLFGPASARGDIDGVSSGALSAYLFAAILLALATGHDSLALLLFCVLVVGTLAIAWRTDAAAARRARCRSVRDARSSCTGRSIST